jgi:hypothetical protein
MYQYSTVHDGEMGRRGGNGSDGSRAPVSSPIDPVRRPVPVPVPYRMMDKWCGNMGITCTRPGREEGRGCWDPVVVWREAEDGVTAVAVGFHLRRSSHRDPTLRPMLSCWPCRSVDRAPETARGVNAIHKRVVDGHDEHLARRLKVGMTDIARHMRRGA